MPALVRMNRLFLYKGHTVGAGILRRIFFMRAYGNGRETAIVLAAAMVLTAFHVTFDRTVGSFHIDPSFLPLRSAAEISIARFFRFMQEYFLGIRDILALCPEERMRVNESE